MAHVVLAAGGLATWEQLGEFVAALVVAGVTVGGVFARTARNFVRAIVVEVLDSRLASIEGVLRDTNTRITRLEGAATHPGSPGLKVHDPAGDR